MSDDRDRPARSAGTDAGAATDERAAASDDDADGSGTAATAGEAVAASARNASSSDGEPAGDAPGATASSPLATGVPTVVGRGAATAVPVSDARLLAPAALAGVSLAVGTLPPDAFDLASGGVGRVVGAPLLAALAVASAWATLGVFDDANARTDAAGASDAVGSTGVAGATDAAWRPDPWRYLAGGTAALFGIRLLRIWTDGVAPIRPVPYLAGNAVVAVLLAPVVAGPVYVLVRRRAGSTENDDSTGR